MRGLGQAALAGIVIAAACSASPGEAPVTDEGFKAYVRNVAGDGK